MSADERSGGTLDDRGCCEGTGAATPRAVENRPGLPAIAYRIGAHPDFLESMLAGLTDARRPALRRLRTREPDDFSIALLDAFAVVADVLTFYQERVANEAYLRTATERLSVIELARLLGYALRPGVAASVDLVFTLEDAPGAPGLVPIPAGTRIQSIPGPDEKPQVYETIAAIEARPAWNALRPQPTEPPTFPPGLKSLWLEGISTGLGPGDAILIVGAERVKDPANEQWDFRRLTSVKPDPATNRTRVTWKEGLGWKRGGKEVQPAAESVTVYAFRQRASLFGSAAPDWNSLPGIVKAEHLGVHIAPNDKGQFELPNDLPDDWPDLTLSAVAPSKEKGLTAEYFAGKDFATRKLRRVDSTVNFEWGSGAPHPDVPANEFSVRWRAWLTPKETDDYTFHTRADDGVRLWVDGTRVIDRWSDSAPADNHSAPIHLVAGRRYAIRLEYYENGGGATIKLRWSGLKHVNPVIIPQGVLTPIDVDTIHLDARYPQITAGTWAVVSTPDYEELYDITDVAEDSRIGYTLSSKTTRLQLSGEGLRERFDDEVRRITVFVQSEQLTPSQKPIAADVGGDSVLLDRAIPEPAEGRRMLLAGRDAKTELPAVEVLYVASAALEGGRTRLTFARRAGEPTKPAIRSTYTRTSVVLYGNVAESTHGESIPDEVVGSGDARQAYQRFKLRQGPVTHVSADVPSGGASTLEVRVDDLLWHEVPTLLGRGPKERVYVTHTDDDGKTTLQFGDGRTGARLPTGNENVRARYRKGLGRDGLVDAAQLSLLITRPLGVRSVTNPLAPAGAQDPQVLADARKNAPLTVLTLDRIVSLRDFEDFARSYAGIAKAHAAWTWNGDARGVLLTVAGIDGDDVLDGSKLHDGLLGAIARAGDPTVPVTIRTYGKSTFDVSADLRVDGDRTPEKVLAAVQEALRASFSFDRRAFGEGVWASEVIAVMQGVAGVKMVDFNGLLRKTGTSRQEDRADYLGAHAPRGGQSIDEAGAAELLTLKAGPLDVKVIQ